MDLRAEYQAGDFVEVTEKLFKQSYPSDSEKEIMWEYFKEESVKLFSTNPMNVKRAVAMGEISQAFLTKLVHRDFKKELESIQSFIVNSKIKGEKAKLFNVEQKEDIWQFSYKGHPIFKAQKKNVQTILKEQVRLDSPALVLSISPQEREQVIQAYWGVLIQSFKNSIKT